MANRFRKLPEADRDLDSIWDYIAVDSVVAANKQVDRIGDVFEMLTLNPLAGRERRELRKGYEVSQSAAISFSTLHSRTASKSYLS